MTGAAGGIGAAISRRLAEAGARSLLGGTKEGHVVSISSIPARTAMAASSPPFAGKAALSDLTLSLARTLAPEKRVVSVAAAETGTDPLQRGAERPSDQRGHVHRAVS